MNNKCGLINTQNPCRCARKTSGFIKAGWVNKDQMKFNVHYLKQIKETLHQKNQTLDEILDEDYAELFQEGPFHEKPHVDKTMATILSNKKVRATFNLN